MRTLILISAIFAFLYSNNQEIDKKTIGYTQNGAPIQCENDTTSNSDTSSMQCTHKNNDNKYETMITFNTFLHIKEGWNVVGIANNIESVKEFLSKDCILHVRKFENGSWQEYNALDGTNNIEKINSNDALFIYSSSTCELNNYGTRTFNKNEIKIQAVSIEDNNITDSIKDLSIDIIKEEDNTSSTQTNNIDEETETNSSN